MGRIRMPMNDDGQAILKLVQLADSAAPIGWAAHSMGLESCVEEANLTIEALYSFLLGWLRECAALEAWFCRQAHRLPPTEWRAAWRSLNDEIGATKLARETRDASATLGRRLLWLAANLAGSSRLREAIGSRRDAVSHHCASFGLIAREIGVSEDLAAFVYVEQSAAAMISAAQRLLPLGQTLASEMLWELKPQIVSAASQTQYPGCFNPALEIASMRHPDLATRLFIS